LILHEIKKYHPPPPSRKKNSKPKHITLASSNKYAGTHGTIDHKRFIHQRSLRENTFEKFENVIYKREVWNISDIYGADDFEYISWDGLSPQYIEIVRACDGLLELVNPGQLKRQRN